ncbi:tRNA modification GTPase MnmE [Gimesia panareensis]|uniref:tRNA modification GTPase MnmE n=1 Tax=Gimesia panareensis TaxID=2527978 RepID=A0A518FHP3_9PLAN|nr:GTPase [Gimesia panareensis]QDV15861.1 tRNA modification GTPase MnmE [Gimesia panareensis]
MTSHPENQSQQPCQAALLTPRGRGAVATIRVQGAPAVLNQVLQACFHAVNRKPLIDQRLNQIVYGLWGESNSEDLVLCRIDSDTVDIHCHGGMAAVERIQEDLRTQGCEIQSWQTLARRKTPALDVELQEVLASATTFRAAEILLRQSQGLLQTTFEALLPGEQSPFEPQRLQSQVQELLRWKQLGLHLTRPWNVVLAGRPNVGKSSLINAILGYERSIVFDEAGTTRDVLTATTALSGWPFQFSDTAGMREEAEHLEAAGIQRAEQILNAADACVILIDTSQPAHPDDERLLTQWPAALIVAHKTDLPDRWGAPLPPQAIPVSSVTKTGLEAFLQQLVQHLIPQSPDQQTAVPVTLRQVELLEQAAEALQAENEQTYSALIRQLLLRD